MAGMAVKSKQGRRITSVRGFVDAAFRQPTSSEYFYAYRGHKSEIFDLLPSVLRTTERRANERRIFQELLSTSSNEFEKDESTFQRLVRAQHYGLPTRLLDVTLNPLVALYFAAEDLSEKELSDSSLSKTGEVLAFKIPWDNVKYSDSDAVSCIANMAYMNSIERRDLRTLGDLTLEEYNGKDVVNRLRQFILSEKPGFRPVINPKEIRNSYFVNPRDSNNRMIAQAGKFLIYGERVSYEQIPTEFGVARFKISSADKQTMRQQLDQLSINGRTLFPEVESAAKYIVAKFLN